MKKEKELKLQRDMGILIPLELQIHEISQSFSLYPVPRRSDTYYFTERLKSETHLGKLAS